MKVKITRYSEYLDENNPSVESFCLEVENEPADTPESVVIAYLELRKKLKEGIKEDK